MTTLSFTALSLSFAGGGGMLVPPPLPDLPPITRYVAPETGNDAADGLTPATAWRYPPGDSRATHGWTPAPGDHVAMKGGERYFGRVTTVGGTVGNPVIYSGNAWGSGRCLIDGADFAIVRAATSQADAGGNPNWANPAVRIVEWPDDALPTWLFDGAESLAIAQSPPRPDAVLFDDVAKDPAYYYSIAQAQQASVRDNFQVTDAAIAAKVASEVGRAKLAIWINNNQYSYRTVTGVAGNVVSFDNTAWGAGVPYQDRNGRIFVQNAATDVVAPGDFAVLAPGKALVWTRGDLAIKRGTGDGGASTAKCFSLQSHSTIRGFLFSNHVNARPFRTGTSRTGFTFVDNLVENQQLFGDKFFDFSSVSGAVVSHCGFRNFFNNSNPMNVTGNDIAVEWSWFTRINATAIQNIASGAGYNFRFLIITNANGVHGNGLSPYSVGSNILVESVAILDCDRPVTTQGDPAGPANRRFVDSVFEARSTGLGRAWEYNGLSAVDGFQLEHCIFIGAGAGVFIKRSTLNTVYARNWSTNGIAGGGVIPGVALGAGSPDVDNTGTWDVRENAAIALTYLQDVAATREFNRVDIPRPDGTRLALDLRGVAA